MTEAAVAGWTGQGRPLAGPDAGDEAIRRVFEHLAGPEGLTARRSSFDRRAVIQALSDAFGSGADVPDVQALAEAFLSSGRVVALPVTPRCGDLLRRRNGSVVPLEADGAGSPRPSCWPSRSGSSPAPTPGDTTAWP